MQARETVTNPQLVSALAPASKLYQLGTEGGDVETKESREASLEAEASFNQNVWRATVCMQVSLWTHNVEVLDFIGQKRGKSPSGVSCPCSLDMVNISRSSVWIYLPEASKGVICQVNSPTHSFSVHLRLVGH